MEDVLQTYEKPYDEALVRNIQERFWRLSILEIVESASKSRISLREIR